MTATEVDVVILGGGLAGLTTAAALGDGTVVLEQQPRPGGLVRTENFNGWWFDHVLHLLHVPDQTTESFVRELLGDVLAPCPPDAWVVCDAGTARYPFQLHLSGLDIEARTACIADFARATVATAPPPRHYADLLLRTFGAAMCEQFYFPYNRKLWRRPLDTLAPTGFQWNLTRPSLEAIVRGALGGDGRAAAYNSNGWYPRPAPGAAVRGMEVLTRALAARVRDLRLGHTVVAVDTERRVVTCEVDGATRTFRYRRACVSTIPLPTTVDLCAEVPADLRHACQALPYNRVRSVALSIRGPRPAGFGHWRYFTDEALPFTRLVSMTDFDPALAPADGWGLLAETIERGEDRPTPAATLVSQVRRGVAGAGVLPAGSVVVDANVIDADPAYVVFTPTSRLVTERAREFLDSRRVHPLGRYGRWEYSSMAQVMTDGLRLARQLRGDRSRSG